MDGRETLSIELLRGLLRRRAGAMALAVGVVFLAAVFLAALLPNRYEAETTLLVEPQAISTRLVEGNLEGSDLNSRIHLMTMQILSRARLSRVIDGLGLYPEESKRRTREEVIQRMRQAIRVEPVLPELEKGVLQRSQDLEINTFRLFFRYDSPEIAAAVADRLANDFIDEHIRERVQRSGDTAEFIDSELKRLATEIREVEAEIARVKSENTGRLPEDLLSNQRLLERAVDNLRAAERAQAQARSDEAFYRQQAFSSANENELTDPASPTRRLRLLELQLAEYRSRGFTDRHPDVVATRQEIEALRGRLDAGEATTGQASSLLQLSARAEQRRAALRAQSAVDEIERLTAQIDELHARLAATPRVAEQLDMRERQYDHLSASFREFSSKRLSAAVAANMEKRQKGEQFRVLEAAYPPPEPVFPNRPLILLLGVLFALATGGCVGVLLESLDGSFHEGRELQETFGLPVLATIPAILLDSERRRLRRRRVRRGLAAAAAVAALLATAGAGYLWVNAPTRSAAAAPSSPEPGSGPAAGHEG